MGDDAETHVVRAVTWSQESETFDAAERVLDRRAVTDADVPCQHCGAEAWELVEIRAEPEAESTRWRLLLCGSCMSIAGRWSAGRRHKRAQADPDLEAWRQEQRDRPSSSAEVIERAGFSVYGLDPSLVRAARLAGYGGVDGQLDAVDVDHRARVGRRTTLVRIRSSIRDQWSGLPAPVPLSFKVRHALGDALDGAATDTIFSRKDLSFEAQMLLSAEVRRRGGAGWELAEQAEVAEHVVRVDAADVTMTVACDASGLWVALVEVGGVTVKVRGEDFDPSKVGLASITDPAEYLGGGFS